VKQLPLICVQPGQKLTICLTHEHCTSRTPFHDSLTTKFQLGALQIVSGCTFTTSECMITKYKFLKHKVKVEHVRDA